MLFVADAHIGLKSDNPPGTLVPVKFKDVKTRFKEVINYASKTYQEIIVCGDVFDNANPESKAISVFIEVINYAILKRVSMFIIPGNHDSQIYSNCLDPIQKAYAHNKLIHFINDYPIAYKIKNRSVLFIPHISETRMEEILKKYKTFINYIYKKNTESEFDIVVGHAHYNKFVSPSNTKILSSGSAMLFDIKTWPKFNICVLGHIHKNQKVDYHNRVILSPGPLIPTNFGEYKNKNYFIEINSDNTYKFIEFKSKVTKYKHIVFNLIKNKLCLSQDILDSCKDKLIKVTVISDTTDNIDETYIRKKLNRYGFIVRFERVIKKDFEDIKLNLNEKDVDYKTLVKQWINLKSGFTEDVKKEAIKKSKDYLNRYNILV